MEKYSSIKNFDRSVTMVRVLAIVGMITVLVFSSCSVVGSAYAISSSLSSSTNLPSVKITFPHKGQQVPVDSNIEVLGISSPPPADKTRTDCTVSVLLNDVETLSKGGSNWAWWNN